MANEAEQRLSYWDTFYEGPERAAKIAPPSQFAAFVAQEISHINHVIDIGCGNGRDSLFFARHGFKVVGLDGSAAAIEACRHRAAAAQADEIQFVQADIAGPELSKLTSQLGDAPLCIYARFFLHAITDEEQSRLFNALAANLKSGDIVAVEYRTTRDRDLEKVAQPHYRRYQDGDEVTSAMRTLGFEPIYVIEGFGFAKYRDEDAHVARGLYRRI